MTVNAETAPARRAFFYAALGFCLSLALFVACAVNLAKDRAKREDFIELARARITGEAGSMAEQLGASLRVVDASLSSLINSLQAADLVPDGAADEVSEEMAELLNAHLLQHSLSLAPQALEFVILDEEGGLLASSAPWSTHINQYMHESPHRLAQKFFDRAASVQPFTLDNRPGQYLLYCRLLPGAQGPTHYIAAAVIAAGQLNPELSIAPMAPQATTALLDADNNLLASWPLNVPSHYEALLKAAEASVEEPLLQYPVTPWQFAVDVENLLVVVSGMRFFPLYLFSAVSHDVVLAQWRALVRRGNVLLGGAAALCICSGAVLAFAARRRRRAAAAEEQGREQYKALVEHFPTGAILLFDPSMRCVLASGLGLHGLWPEYGPPDRAQQEPRPPVDLPAPLADMLPQAAARTMETHLGKALNGARVSFTLAVRDRYYEIFLMPIRDWNPETGRKNGDSLAFCMAVFTDITQREISRQALRQSEARYRTLARNMPDGIALLFDRELRLLLADGRSLADFGVPSGYAGSIPEDAALTDVLSGELAGHLIPLCREAFAGEAAQVELPINGRYFEVNIEPVPNASGEVLQCLLVARDISGRKRFEEAILQARDAAESANRMKSHFVATISHELRTPVTGILGMTEAALSQPPGERQSGFLEKIGIVARNLSGLINDLLDFSRMEAGKLSLSPEACLLRPLLESALEPLMPEAREKELEVSIDIAPDVPEAILADPVRLSQVLLNLAGNAVKFTDFGQVTVTVSRQEGETGEGRDFGEETGGEPPTLLFEVKDTGPGIRAGLQDKIFESFTQAEDGYARSHTGSGLGLAISRQMVELWKGRIGVVSAPGRGSLFWFTLPLVALDAKRDAKKVTPPKGKISALRVVAPQKAQPESTGRAATGRESKKLRVLLAEDNELIREFLTLFLEEQGHTVMSAADGAAALDVLEDAPQPPDLIFMDVQMRRMNGLEATAAIRSSGAAWAGVPIIGLTAYAAPADQQQFLAAGMNEVLAKPITREDILAAVARHVS